MVTTPRFDSFEDFKTLRKQIFANAFILYGRDHVKVGRFDVIIGRSQVRQPNGSMEWKGQAAVIFWLHFGHSLEWKLLKKSGKYNFIQDAMVELKSWIEEDAGKVLDDMIDGDTRDPV